MSLPIPQFYYPPSGSTSILRYQIDRMAASSYNFAIMQGRVDMALAHAQTTTNATFVVPTNLGDSVTIPLTSLTNVRVGDDLVIGAPSGYYTATAKVTSTITFTAFRHAGYVTATVTPSGQFVVDVLTPSVFTTTTGTFAIPEVFNNSSSTVTVTTPANVTVGRTYLLSLYAGTYRITALGVSNVTARLIAAGDIPAGQTVPSGREAMTCRLLGVTKAAAPAMPLWRGSLPYVQFCPFDQLYVSTISQTAASAANAVITVGWTAANSQEWNVGSTIGLANAFTPNTYRIVAITTQDGRRLAAPPNSPIFMRVTTAPAGTTSWVAHWLMRGFYAP